jgi:Pro-kumamolisin, activation domain/Bacterial Ig-like domain (group 3)
MKFQNRNSNRHSVRLLSSPSCLAVLLLSFACLTARSQQPHISTAQNIPYAINTPREVMSGSATLIQPYDPASKLRLAISITAPKMAEEEKFLKELQDRTSPNFHKWLTPEQWNARFAPAPEDEQAVVDWATSQGLTITARYPNRLMVNVEGTVDTIQKAFNIKINHYQVNGAVEFSNDRDPQIPANLGGIIQYVDGLNSIVRMRPANSRMKGVRGPDYAPGAMHQMGESVHMNADSAAAQLVNTPGAKIGSQITNSFYDPSDFWSQQGYNYNALQALGHCCNPLHNAGQTPPETSIGLATDGDFADSDMVGFHNQYPYLAYHYNRVFVNGTPAGGDDETTLDLEWTTATSNSRGSYVDTSYIWVYEAAQGFGDFGTLFQQMVNDNFVRVVNISYGLSETIFLADAPSLLTSWHAIFNQMIGQGWTIMAASGDGGSDAGCTGSLAVLYPESDPDVTSVGGTELFLNLDGSFNTEVAWTGDTFAGACSKNDGGGGGGCSAVWAAPGYQVNPYCGSGSRSVPDVSLNAGVGTNFYFGGALQGVGGTSLASPLMSGFIAQENAYSLSMGNACDGTHNCAPIGQVNRDIYAEGGYNMSAPHYPFYDITSGCTSNDTISSAWCAASGYDLATGWGAFNALQMAWAINWEDNLAYSAPSVSYSGPGTNTWYNTDQAVSWTINANGNPTGIAGFTQGWDSIPGDPFFDGDRNDSNSFFSGPQFPNATSGCLSLNGGFGCAGGVSQGCHTAHVRAWSNQGSTSGDATYGPICYDTVAPVTTAALSGTLHGSVYDSAVMVTLSASDATSGVAHAYYSIDGGGYATYSGAFTISALGTHTVRYYSKDVAGNVESAKSVSFTISSLTTTTLTSSLNPSKYGEAVTLKATVTPSFGGTASGTVTFYHLSTVLGTGTLSGNVASLTLTTFWAGTTHVTATYGGNGNYLASTSNVLAQVVNQASTTTTVVSSSNPSTHGTSVTFTATVHASSGPTPTGSVTFKDGSTTLGTGTLNGSGGATFSTSALAVGTHSITAAYGGSSNDTPSTSTTLSQKVD